MELLTEEEMAHLSDTEKDSKLIDDESEKSIDKEVEEEQLDDLNNSN